MIKTIKITGEMKEETIIIIIIIISRNEKMIEEIIIIKKKKNKEGKMKGITVIINERKHRNRLKIKITMYPTKIEEKIIEITTKTNNEVQTLRVITKEAEQAIIKVGSRVNLSKGMLNLLRSSTSKVNYIFD